MIKRLVKWLMSPFTIEFPFYALLFLMASLPNDILYLQRGKYLVSLENILGVWLISYFVVLIVTLFKNGVIRNVIKVFPIVILQIYASVLFYCKYVLNNDSIIEVASVLSNSNISEAKEFISTSLPVTLVVGVIGYIMLTLFLLFYFMRRKVVLSSRFAFAGLSFVALSFIIISCTSLNFSPTSYSLMQRSIKQLREVPPNLKEYPTNPSIAESRDIHPSNLVVIIGESHLKDKSSLYGYEKETNPLLGSIDSLLLLNNVKAAELHTIEAFQNMMSIFSSKRHSNDMWYRMTTIPEAFNVAGYRTMWISNQNRRGFYDNIPSKYSMLCHEQLFVKELEAATGLDYDVVQALDSIIVDGGKNLYFIHLMGQHSAFYQRYPSEFEKFAANHYMQYPEHQRVNRAQYDNASLYNDYVVHSIIDKFKDMDAVVLYFPDHAIDLYATDEDYCGHAKNDEKSRDVASHIPFIVYLTQSYREKAPELYERVLRASDNEFNLDELIYLLMDFAGYRFADNDDVKKYSILD